VIERLPRLLLHLEGAALAGAALIVYLNQGYRFWVLLVLAPDLSALGYLAGRRAGTVADNAAHTTVWPIARSATGSRIRARSKTRTCSASDARRSQALQAGVPPGSLWRNRTTPR